MNNAVNVILAIKKEDNHNGKIVAVYSGELTNEEVSELVIQYNRKNTDNSIYYISQNWSIKNKNN